MTSKERAALRGRANSLRVLFQVGKGGISDTLIDETKDALKARELIKLRVLTETAPVSARAAAEEIAAKTGAEVVQVIGSVIVLYKLNPELHKAKPKVKVTSKKLKAAPKKAAFKKKSPFEDKKGRDKRIVKKTSTKEK